VTTLSSGPAPRRIAIGRGRAAARRVHVPHRSRSARLRRSLSLLPGDEWATLASERDVPGRRWFSRHGFAELPQAYTAVESLGAHFEFEVKPACRRFYGINFCGTATSVAISGSDRGPLCVWEHSVRIHH
jgi:hypothetical protein